MAVTINGLVQGWENVRIWLNGIQYPGTTAIGWSDSEAAPQGVYHQGDRSPKAMGLGEKPLVQVTWTMLARDYRSWAGVAQAAGKSPRDYLPFTIMVGYTEFVESGKFIGTELTSTGTRTLRGVKVTDIQEGSSQGQQVISYNITAYAMGVS